MLISGWSPLRILNAAVWGRPYHLTADLVYGTGQRQRLDVYVPKHMAANPTVVIFFFGGRWQSGDKRDYRFVGEALASKGLIAVIPNYRLYPEVHWRGFLRDGASAYAWVERNITRFHGNPGRIFLMGHSAGAYIAAMIALDPAWRRAAGSGIAPCGLIGVAGPYDFLPFTDADVQHIFSTARHAIDTQPIHYVSSTAPPALLLTGASDTTVRPRNAIHLAAALRAHGDRSQVIEYRGVAHISILLSLARPFRFLAPTLRDTVAFIHATQCPTR
ncbi:MAG: alpha/beta hydrolase [Acidiferrobacteraceae bacterium]